MMKVTKEKAENGKIKLTVEVDTQTLEKASDVVYKNIVQTVKVAGFRPGKAPKDLVEKEVGKERIEAEILDSVVPQTYYEAVLSEGVEAVGAPEIKVIKFVPSDGLTYEATVEIMPEIKLPDLTKIKVKRQPVKVTKEEIDDTLNDLAKQLAKNEVVEREAKKGDRVEIDFEGFVDNVPFEGGKSSHYPIVLGSGSFIPGFEEQLEGLKATEEKDVKVTFPKEYHAENLAGKEAVFKVKVHQVEEIISPEITDEFAKSLGKFETLKDLKEDVEKELHRTKESNERKRVEDLVLEEMAGKVTFDAPKTLVSQETHRLLHEAEQNLAYSGMTMEKYFEMTKQTPEQLEEQLRPEGEKRVKIGLLLTEIAKEQKFESSDSEINEFITKRTEFLPEEQKKQALEYYDSHEGRHQVENAVIGKKVIDYLYEKCSK